MAGNFLPGTASLLEELDKKLLVLLRDGRTLIGFLRSIDQFGNIVLHRTIERIHVGNKFGDIARGIFLIRGENMVLCGEMIGDEENPPGDLVRVDVEEILELQHEMLTEKQEAQKIRRKTMIENRMAGAFFATELDPEDV